MNHRGKIILGVVFALLLMAAGAGLVLSAFRISGNSVRKEAQASAVEAETPDVAEEQAEESALLLGWDGQYTVSTDGLELRLTKRLLPEEDCLQPDFHALCEEICYDAVDASFSTDGSHTILPE